MLRYDELGGSYKKMVNWVLIPKEIDRKDIDEYEHLKSYRQKIQQCLQFQPTTKKLTIAPHHFRECLNSALERTRKEMKTINKFRCYEEEAKQAGIGALHECDHIPGSNQRTTYFLIPNNSLDVVENELKLAEAMKCLCILTDIARTAQSQTNKEQVRIIIKIINEFSIAF